MSLTVYLSVIKVKKIFLVIAFIFSVFMVNGKENEKNVQIELILSEENSKKYLTAKVNELVNDSIGGPVGELDLFFYVQRTFSLLPIGDYFNTTEQNGMIRVEFPSDLPGDSIGNVLIIVKLLDADDYADTEVQKTVKWGVPTYFDSGDEKRTLWAAGANAPISLLLLVNILIAAVWGIIFYIIFKIYRISKM